MSHAAVLSPAAACAARLTSAAHLFCFLDYDGTLAPIAPTPDEAVPLPGTKDILEDLAAAPDTAVAIVTGRTISEVRQFLDVPAAYYVGVHGNETAAPGGPVELAPEAVSLSAALPEIREVLFAAFATVPGVLIEDKGCVLACHYRRASRLDAERLRAAATALVEKYRRWGTGIDIISGHEVIELRPPGINKGTAVCKLLQARPPALALYIGDDTTDEEAFACLPADAITIRVGPADQPTFAAYRVDDPMAAQSFLQNVLACRDRHGAKAKDGD